MTMAVFAMTKLPSAVCGEREASLPSYIEEKSQIFDIQVTYSAQLHKIPSVTIFIAATMIVRSSSVHLFDSQVQVE